MRVTLTALQYSCSRAAYMWTSDQLHEGVCNDKMCDDTTAAGHNVVDAKASYVSFDMLCALGCVVQGAKSKYMVELQKERDTLAKEKTALLQKLQAVTQASAEERKRLEQTYKDKLTAVERRLKDLAEREKAAKRNAAQLVSSGMVWHGMHHVTLSLGDLGPLTLQQLCAP